VYIKENDLCEIENNAVENMGILNFCTPCNAGLNSNFTSWCVETYT